MSRRTLAGLGVSTTIWAAQSLLRAFKRHASESWAAAMGTAESSQVKKDPRDNGLRSPYELQVAYSYRAAGDWYSGYEARRFSRETDADEASRAMRRQSLVIRYNPQRPEQSVLHWTPLEK